MEINTVKELISINKTQEAIDLLKDIVIGNDLFNNELIMMNARYVKNESYFESNQITIEDYKIECNKKI